jgi:hypothetical protein
MIKDKDRAKRHMILIVGVTHPVAPTYTDKITRSLSSPPILGGVAAGRGGNWKKGIPLFQANHPLPLGDPSLTKEGSLEEDKGMTKDKGKINGNTILNCRGRACSALQGNLGICLIFEWI